MEIYDTANKLADEIRNSKQYKDFKNSKNNIMSNVEKQKKILEFEELKREVQIIELKKQQGIIINEQEKRENLAKMYNTLILDEEIKQYFNYEILFNQMMLDINKIIANSIKDVL